MITFRVLGPLDLRGPDGEQVLSILVQPKRTALLAYLAASEPGAFHRRDKLIALFWPESDQDRARGALRKSVHFLRRSLGDEAILNRGDESLGLRWEDFWVDAGAFEAALNAEDAEGALELYRGDFLEGFFLDGCLDFESWIDGQRKRLKEMASGAAWSLSHRLLGEGRINDGERAASRALGLVPTDESEARRFIQALAVAGDRAAAVQFFETFARGIQEELGLAPSAETVAAVEEIRRGGERGTTPPSTDPPGRQVPVSVSSDPNFMGREITPEVPVPGEAGSGMLGDFHPLERPVPTPGESDLDLLTRELGPEVEVLRQIGSGTLGDVYLARQPTLGRLVVVKIMRHEFVGDPAARARFERTAKAIAAVDHPNVARVHWFGVFSNGVPYLVREYVKGGTLADRLSAEGPLPIALARKILAQVADALAAAHRSGFVHRNVGPAAVLYDAEAHKAVLSDFGLAGILPENVGTLPRLTMAGEVIGSADSLSPEQLRGEDPTEKTDVYALGILGYQLLTGESPYPGTTQEQRARAHLMGTPRPLAALRPDVPDGMADLLERCLAKEPKLRPRPAYLAENMRSPDRVSSGDVAQEAEKRSESTSNLSAILPHGRMSRVVAVVVVLLAVIGSIWVVGRVVELLS